jgi:hydrogenase-4 component F
MVAAYFLISALVAGGIYFLPNRPARLTLAGAFLVVQMALTLYGFTHFDAEDSLFFTFDRAGVICLSVLTMLSIATFYHSVSYAYRHKMLEKHESLYFAFLVLFVAALTGANLTNHLGALWTLIEASTLTVAVLIYHERTKQAVEATWKYIFLCSIGISLAFAGILFLAAEAANHGVKDLKFSELLAHASEFDPTWVQIAFLLLVTGLSVKLGVFPFHTASINAQTTAPQPVNALLSTVLKNTSFLAIFRIYQVVSHTQATSWASHLLLLTGILSLVVAALQLSRVIHLSRMLGYSGVEHFGLILMGIGAGGLGYYAAFLHMILHSFAKASLFYQNDQIHRHFLSYRVNRLGNYLRVNPLGGLVVLLSLLGIMAMPPSGLFISELLIFKALFANGHMPVAILALILLLFVLYFFTKNILHLLYDTSDQEMIMKEVKTSPWESVSQLILLGLMIAAGFVQPTFLVNLIEMAVK